MITFYGVVEDRQDPMEIGRVRVRIHNIHTHNKQDIATPDLPWAQVLMPTTVAGLSGFGNVHSLVEGTTVFGFFRDGENMQDPVIIGVAQGIPSSGSRKTIDDELITPTVDQGFNDPRRLTIADYEGTPDGKNPVQDTARGFGLETALDSAPKVPESLNIDYTGSGSTITNPTLTDSDLPYYPRYRDASDISPYARGGKLEAKNLSSLVANFPDSPANPLYPYNKVLQSESGHVLEIDDSLDSERLSAYHRSGSFVEIHPDGSKVTQVVNNNYTVTCKDEEVYIGGKVNIVVIGESNVNITGDTTIEVAGDTSIKSPNITLDGKLTVTGAVNMQSTLDVVDEVTGNGVELSKHVHLGVTSGSAISGIPQK